MEIKTEIITWPNGKLRSRTRYYIDSSGEKKCHGLLESWYENGQKAGEKSWRHGEDYGTFIVWRQDGTVSAIGEFKGFLKHHGIQKNWYRNCQLQNELYFENGKIKEGISYSSTGEEVTRIKDGNGIYFSYHENGKVCGEFDHKDSQEIKVTTWYDNGQMAQESFYGDNGLLQVSVTFDPNGNKVGEVIKGNGKISQYNLQEPYGHLPFLVISYENGKKQFPPEINL